MTRYVCSGGILALVAHGDTRFPGVEKPGVDSWVLDTGSGHHLVSAATLDPASRGTLRKAETPLKLCTANGVTKVTQACDCRVPILGATFEVSVLPKTPNVLSIHKLVERGAEFWWDSTGAWLRYCGTTHYLTILRGVPLLPAGMAI